MQKIVVTIRNIILDGLPPMYAVHLYDYIVLISIVNTRCLCLTANGCVQCILATQHFECIYLQRLLVLLFTGLLQWPCPLCVLQWVCINCIIFPSHVRLNLS